MQTATQLATQPATPQPIQHHYYALANGKTLHYTAWGNPAAQPVVCVHGLTRNARDFDFLAQYLSDTHGFYVLCVDVIGRGESSWANEVSEYAVPVYALQILEWLDALKLVSPHWVGTSMGGLIALAMQLIAPHRLGKVVLNDIGPAIDAEGLARIAHYIGAAPQFDNRAQAESYAKQVFVGFGAQTPAEWAGLCDHYFVDIVENIDGIDNLNNLNNSTTAPKVRLHYDPLIATATKNYVASLTDELRRETEAILWRSLKSFKQAVYVLRGEASDLLTANTLAAMQAINPLLSAQVIAGCGHAPHLMNTAQAQLLADFFNRV
jgi:pimeloyl-ACP methyl ester carboxylesterase